MNPAIDALFQYTRSHVTEQDIVDFSPGDPGYANYVRVWTEILRTGVVPRESHFDLSEVIALTGWSLPEDWERPDRFLAYRRFTSAVAVTMLHFGNHSEDIRTANYLARDLLIDLDRANPHYFSLLREVFPVVRDLLAATHGEPEYPFFTFGEMLLAQWAEDWETSQRAATRLIKDENAVRQSEVLGGYVESDRFLLGLTNYDQLHDDWRAFAANLKNPTGHEETQLVIEALGA